ASHSSLDFSKLRLRLPSCWSGSLFYWPYRWCGDLTFFATDSNDVARIRGTPTIHRPGGSSGRLDTHDTAVHLLGPSRGVLSGAARMVAARAKPTLFRSIDLPSASVWLLCELRSRVVSRSDVRK